MKTDIILGDEPELWVRVEGAALDVRGADILLDADHRRSTPDGHRRALVHDEGDALSVNHAGDYPGGLRLHDAVVHLRPRHVSDPATPLPADGIVGDLHLRVLSTRGSMTELRQSEASLWLCVPDGPLRGTLGAGATWRQIQLGDAVYSPA